MDKKHIRLAIHAFSLLVGISLIVAYILFADPRSVFTAIVDVSIGSVILAILAFLSVWGLRVWTFHRLGKALDEPVSWTTSNRAFLGSGMLNLIFPARMGDVSLVVHLARSAGYGGATALVAQYRAQSLLALISLTVTVIALSVLLPGLNGMWGLFGLFAAFMGTLMLVGLVMMGLILRSHNGISAFASWLGRYRYLDPVVRKGRGFVRNLLRITKPSLFLPAIIGAGVAWFLEILIAVHFILLLAPGTNLLLAFGAPLAGTIAGTARLTPGGLGIFEGTMIGILLSQGVVAVAAVGAATVIRVFMTFMLLVMGTLPGVRMLRDTTDAGFDAARKRMASPVKVEPREGQ